MSQSTTLTRRGFTFGLPAYALLQGKTRYGANQPLPRLLVDTHLHCFAGRKSERFPYHERAPYRPEEIATPQHLLKCMTGAGVDYAVVVHPEAYQDDHRYLEYCLELGEGKLKGTILLFPDRPLYSA